METLELIRKNTASLVGRIIDISNIQQRGIGDKIESIVSDTIKQIKHDGLVVESATSKRSMEDVQILNKGQIWKIDTKSHDIDSDFSMPNLVSIDRLRVFYQNPNAFLVYALVDYKCEGNLATITNIEVRLIEELDWSILAIQNLGKGQLQIKNMNLELKFIEPNRAEWMANLQDRAIVYYNSLIIKIERYKRTWSK